MSKEIPSTPSPQDVPDIALTGKDWVLTQAFTRLQQRQFTDAIKLLQGLRVLAPEDSEVYRMLSYSLLMADQPEECLSMADRYLQCMPPGTDTQEISWIQGRAKVRLEKARLKQAKE
ncbi:tetratricopeptide repeat protein [Sansalvadorimonas verongulae]|uniref:tetratricopeptide repeat protein n=1 Tax=Sansalvadorimonas verongulae TaxID=2172824 RepID=UPI0012BC13FB|nr:hypothetical protein [Sansalvadorimonas verongulae]MTI14161.1 hypothetical protein [Sansalvadorimonas verongulae]